MNALWHLNRLVNLPSETLYKGIALITPGGDVVYAIDPSRQQRWHTQLCLRLQTLLKLPEPPLFLTPSHTATVDRWLDPQAQVQMAAEVYPALWRYRIFLQTLFDVPVDQWQMVATPSADPWVINSYRDRFPQLWQCHNWILRMDEQPSDASQANAPSSLTQKLATDPQGYVLHLFVAGHRQGITRILEELYRVLEQALTCPYTLKVIDVAQHPEQAEAAQVLATPTLLRVWPEPAHRIVGALESQRILELLTV